MSFAFESHFARKFSLFFALSSVFQHCVCVFLLARYSEMEMETDDENDDK